jgi:2-amino-4-hydroxy-6-hydroxymethyldihydropteridine diphosphokinase
MVRLQLPVLGNADELAFVAVGSNLASKQGNSLQTVENAVLAVAKATETTAQISRFFRTPAYPLNSGPDFVNAVFAIRWTAGAADLLTILHKIEREFGRLRTVRWGARVLDLDLLALGQTVLPDFAEQEKWRDLSAEQAGQIAPDTLILPHPRLQDRAFVLVPWADIAPDWAHPSTGLTVRQMMDALPEVDRASMTALTAAAAAQ